MSWQKVSIFNITVSFAFWVLLTVLGAFQEKESSFDSFLVSFLVIECKEQDGVNADGFLIKCFDSSDKCLSECVFTCTLVDHCKGSEKSMVACTPSVWL